jgi:hypothetical protein
MASDVSRLFHAVAPPPRHARAPTAKSCAVVWYLDQELQNAAQFPDREAALAWAENVRELCLGSEGAPRASDSAERF